MRKSCYISEPRRNVLLSAAGDNLPDYIWRWYWNALSGTPERDRGSTTLLISVWSIICFLNGVSSSEGSYCSFYLKEKKRKKSFVFFFFKLVLSDGRPKVLRMIWGRVIIFLEGQLHSLNYCLNNVHIPVPMTVSLRSTCRAIIISSFYLSEYTEKLQCRWASDHWRPSTSEEWVRKIWLRSRGFEE